MRKGILALFIVLLLVLSFLAGFYLRSADVPYWSDGTPDNVKQPEWEIGQYWVYAFTTPEVENTIAKIVVTEIDSENYHLGISSRLDAQRHAVLNYNPMLGRITKENLGVYEEGEPQTVLLFPLEKGKTWRFTLMGMEGLDAKVTSIENTKIPGEEETVIVDVKAEGPNGEVLKYSYDASAEWFRSMVLTTSAGDELLRMTLISSGTGYRGEAYFIRGLDLYDRSFTSSPGSPEVNLYDTFIDTGHPSWGPFDSLIYYYRVATGGSSNGVLTIRDHSTTTTVRKEFQSGVDEGGLGSVDSNAGEWGVTVMLRGDCDLHIMIAGGIEYAWTL
jgi:hypothetical protein